MRVYVYRYLRVLCLLLVAGLLYGQGTAPGPYRLSAGQDYLIGGLAVGAAAGGQYLHYRTDDVLLRSLNLPAVPSFDRTALGRNSEAAVRASDGVAIGTLVLPGLFLTDQRIRRDAVTLGVLLAETIVLNQGVTDLIKGVVRRPRPYVYASDLPPRSSVTAYDRSSYPSNHTSTTAAAAFFAGRVFADYYPNSRLRPYVWVAAASLPAVAGYLRVAGGQHFPSDVVAGYGLGALIGYGIPLLHRRRSTPTAWSVTPYGPGIVVRYRPVPPFRTPPVPLRAFGPGGLPSS